MPSCQCKNCQKALLPSSDPWVKKIRGMILDGRLVHLGNTPDGRAIYREV
jgi:hypothetical protein